MNHESNSESWTPGNVYVSEKIFFKKDISLFLVYQFVSNQSEFGYYIKAFGKF
jgi:hypothetical protein